MKEEIFIDCLKTKQVSSNQPFWDNLAKKYAQEGYRSGEHLRGAFKNELRRRKKNLDIPDDIGESTSFEQGQNFINVICSSKRILSEEDIIKEFNVDTDIWEIERFKIKTSEGYRKDRQVEWHVSDGKVTTGDVSDTGKMLVVPLFHVEARFIKKVKQAAFKSILEEMKEEAKNFSPKYTKINYEKRKDGHLYEIDFPDVHFGRLSWSEESGGDYDIKLAKSSLESVVDQLLINANNYPIERILLPIGNDFFNSDTPANTTTRGTPMQEDTRWAKTFRKGRELIVDIIDRCSTIAPVDVLVISGNHDEQRSYFLGEALECWYHNSPNVSIDNSARSRKYYDYGKNLIGFTHGYTEKLQSLPLTMAMEVPELWAKTKYREIHTGDKHHKRDTIYAADEGLGIVVRILRSLAVADAWTFDKGFIGAIRSAEAFMWHPEDGLVAQFTAMPKI